MEFYRKKKVLITGHTGFKGSWLSRILLSWGAEVVGIALPPATNPSLFKILNLKNQLKHYEIDIRDQKRVNEIFLDEKPEIVFHLAAQPIVRASYDDPVYTHTTNILGTTHVLECIRGSESVRSAVIITTDKVYRNDGRRDPYQEADQLAGFDPYSASKAAADIVAQSYIQSFFNPHDYGRRHRTLIGIARAGNVIGGGDWSHDRLIPDIVRTIFHERREKIILRNPRAERPWQHVLEPLFGYLLFAQELYKGRHDISGPYNFGPENGERGISVEAIARTAIQSFGKGFCEIVPDLLKHEDAVLHLDIAKAKNDLKWLPILSVQEGLEWTFDWYRAWYENPTSIESLTFEQISRYHQKSHV